MITGFHAHGGVLAYASGPMSNAFADTIDKARSPLRAAARHLPVVVLMAAAVVVYLPALRSPLVGDDYLLLVASRDMSFAHFLNSAANPWAGAGALQLSTYYWRPLSFLSFRGIYALFGDHVLAYHLFNLSVHLAAVVLVYALTLRLVRTRPAALVAAAVMALHPAGVESIAWISSLNSAGLPFALGAWLVFIHATEGPVHPPRVRWLASALALGVVALAFRETSDVILAAMLLWYALVAVRGRWRERETLLAAAPFAILLAAHTLFVGRVHSPGSIALDRHALTTGWYYVKLALFPVQSLNGPEAALQQLLGVLLIAVPFVALVRRQWLIAALGFGLLVSIVPYAAFGLGFGPRYFYFPSAMLALLAGAVTAEFVPRLERARYHAPLVAGAVAAAIVLISATTIAANVRVRHWVTAYPDQHQAWVDQLRAQYPTLPAGGGLFVVDPPFVVAILGGYIVGPTVTYYYPGADHPIYIIDEAHIAYAKSVMKPDDRMLIFEAR